MCQTFIASPTPDGLSHLGNPFRPVGSSLMFLFWQWFLRHCGYNLGELTMGLKMNPPGFWGSTVIDNMFPCTRQRSKECCRVEVWAYSKGSPSLLRCQSQLFFWRLSSGIGHCLLKGAFRSVYILSAYSQKGEPRMWLEVLSYGT